MGFIVYIVNLRRYLPLAIKLHNFILYVDAPGNLRVIALTSLSVKVTWNPSSPLSNVTGYLISYFTTALYTSGGNVTVNDVTTTVYNLTNLEENTPYTITVQAINNNGMSGDSNAVSITTYTASK